MKAGLASESIVEYQYGEDSAFFITKLIFTALELIAY